MHSLAQSAIDRKPGYVRWLLCAVSSALALTILLAAPPALALSAEQAYARMNAALAPERTLLSRAYLAIWLEGEQTQVYEALVARKGFGDQARTTVVILEPEFVAGVGSLWGTRRADGTPIEAVYRPVDRRVTEIAPVMPDDPLLGSNFTRADLGFVARGELELRLVGERKLNLNDTLVVEAKPRDSWYYSRILTWIDTRTWLPVKREYYDRAGRLWKRAEYQGTLFEDTPVVIRITMEDLQSLTRSELVMSRIRLGDAGDDVLFDRAYLERAKAHLLEALAPPGTQGTAE